MDLDTLRKNIGILTLSELEHLGLADEDGWNEEVVKVYNTSEDTDKKENSTTWIAAINSEEMQFVFIANGILYNEASQLETGKEVEVGRLLLTESKADMLVEAIRHAFPHLLTQDEEEGEEEETEGDSIQEESKEDLPKPRKQEPMTNENELPLSSLEDVDSIDEAIVVLRRNIYLLEQAQKEGFEIKKTTGSSVALKKEQPAPVPSDALIDAYAKCKDKVKEIALKRQQKASSDGELVIESMPRNGGKTLFVATSPKSGMIHLLEANLDLLARQDHQLRGNVSAINVDKQLGKKLLKLFGVAFVKTTSESEKSESAVSSPTAD